MKPQSNGVSIVARVFSAGKIGQSAKGLSCICSEGEVHSVFTKSINIALYHNDALYKNPIITLCGDNVSFHSANIMIYPNPYFADWGISQGDRVLIGNDVLSIGNSVIVSDIDRAAVWYPDIVERIKESGVACDERAKKRILEKTSYLLTNVDIYQNGGFYPLIPLFWDMMSAKERTVTDKVCNIAFHAVSSLINTILCNDAAGVENAVGRLIGLGEGLTPSGDDFLAGFVSVRHILLKAFDLDSRIQEKLSEAILSNIHRTTSISRHFLSYALEGSMNENTNEFVFAMLCLNDEELMKCTRELLSYGATSGLDMLLGILAGFYSMSQ